MARWVPARGLSVLILCAILGTLNSQKPCHQYFCFCHGTVANCSYNGNALTHVPRPTWPKIDTFYFDFNYLPQLTRNTFKNIKDLPIKFLSLRGNQIKNISRVALYSLNQLEILYLSDNTIEPKFFKESLQNAKKLVRLYLNNMNISSLPFDMFRGLENGNVERIYLANNRLHQFDQSTIQRLTQLTTLDLSDNQITSLALNNSEILGTLLLASNQLNSIPNFCTNGSTLYPRLWKLDLENNNISIVNTTNFRCLTFLREFHMSRNNISRIPDNAFSGLTNLDKLYITSNKAKSLYIYSHTFNGSHLSYLNLSSSSPYFQYHYAFKNCSLLRSLDMSYGKAFKDNDFFLNGLLLPTELESFWCINCHLKLLPMALKNMVDLKYLFLDENYISVIHDHVFDSNVRLSHLSFRQNNITSLSGFDISYSVRYNLKYISFEDNPFTCDCRLLWLKNWIDKDRKMFIGQFMNYKCAKPAEVKGLQLLDVGIVSDKRCLMVSPFNYVVGLVGAAFACLLIIALVYKCRYRIFFCFIKRRPSYSEESRPLLQKDAYVVYCDENYHPWIRRELMSNLEERRLLHLVIRQRDFDQSHNKVSNIVENLKCCRRVLVVLSNSFFKDSNSQDELSLILRCIEDQRGLFVVVLLEDIDDRYMSRPLCHLLQITTQLQWPLEPDQRRVFWENLKTSITEPSLHSFS